MNNITQIPTIAYIETKSAAEAAALACLDTAVTTCRKGQLELKIRANRRAVTQISLILPSPNSAGIDDADSLGIGGADSLGFDDADGVSIDEDPDSIPAPAALACRQLGEYFSGARRNFDFPIELYGTPFRLKVWRALTTIGYGDTMSYIELARRIGQPRAARAVGGAAHNNPVPIAVPCHRLVGSDGSLTGFACGLDMKAYLLRLEAETAAMQG